MTKTLPAAAKAIIAHKPEIAGLSATLDMPLFWRNGVLWARDIQLTFPKEKIGEEFVPVNDERNAEIAAGKLKAVQDARSTWGSKCDRAMEVLQKFREEFNKPETEYLPMHWFIVKTDGQDSAAYFMGPHPWSKDTREAEVSVNLVGEEKLIRGRGKTVGDAILACMDQARRKFSEGA